MRVRSVSGEGGGMIPGVLSSHRRDNQPSVYGWNRRRLPLRVRSVSGEGGGGVAYTFNDKRWPDSYMGGL
jgi:hypothetical protein